MIILALRTDKPEAELYLYENTKRLDHIEWLAHRQLAETIHQQINQLLTKYGKTVKDVDGIACYQGPGSFTGLRIGLTVANALAYSLEAPIVAATGDNWLEDSVARLEAGQSDDLALPAYGADVHITLPKQQQ